MAQLPDGSVDAEICDPPYGTVKGLGDGEGIDHGMAGRTGWDDELEPALFLAECNRILRMNGAMVLFSQEPYTTRLISEAHGNLPFSYRMTWLKDHFANALVAKKAPVSYTEDVLVFFKKYDTQAAHPLHDYAARMLAFIGRPRKQIWQEMGHQGAFHWFLGANSIQVGICTRKSYDQLVALYEVDRMAGFLPYAEVVAADDWFKSQSARCFNLPEGQKYKSNVLQYRKDYSGHHPTQKPVALMDDLVKTYTNPGDTVLDFTMGSGSTGVACVNTGRQFIGIERDDKYFAIASERIANARRGLFAA
jgi:site-specific DNA-methyltransferase (adenine-specific)